MSKKKLKKKIKNEVSDVVVEELDDSFHEELIGFTHLHQALVGEQQESFCEQILEKGF